MPLTPQDVQNKTFATSGLGRKGYDEAEVDDFLDEIVAELTRLLEENATLRGQLAEAEAALAAAGGPKRTTAAAGATATVPVSRPAPAGKVGGPAPSDSAARILALAQQTADQHVAEARTEAETIVGEARSRAEKLAREAEQRQQEQLGGLERRRSELERRVDDLRAFEKEFRTRLTAYLERQLHELQSQPTAAPDAAAGAPS